MQKESLDKQWYVINIREMRLYPKEEMKNLVKLN